jgi:hypothetical protein
MLLLLSACGVDSGDGDVTNTLAIPTDNELNLYCADIGLYNETCVLDDPDNPYARTPFFNLDPADEDQFNSTKFALATAVAGNPKALFYLYATAQARAPSGENQWYTARALHELYTSSGSDLIRLQTIRAYRSALDNYFDSATFFVAGFLPSPPPGGVAFPVLIRELTAQDLSLTPTGFTPLFDPADVDNNQFISRETLGSWGYTWVGMVCGPACAFTLPGPVSKN